VPQRGGVVDQHDVAGAQGERGEVGGGEDRPGAARLQRQQRLLPYVAGPVGQRTRRRDHAVGVGTEARQLLRQGAGHSLHSADLAPDGGPRVDDDRLNLIG
jgi:hypothetical protein